MAVNGNTKIVKHISERNHQKNKGFTLIELLMVVAIIAILASAVLVNLFAGRQKAKNSAYIAYVSQMTHLVENANALGLFNQLPQPTGAIHCLGDYGGTCWTGGYSNDAVIDSILTDICNISTIFCFLPCGK
jgi:prepilin-type N-terminal cleavage/methylation domain-containing protein